jgi:hypothetical protein
MSSTLTSAAPAPFGLTAAKVRAALVSMVFISSFFVKFEPAPSDVFFMLAFAACLTGGLRFSPAIMPLFFLLLLYNVSVLVSYTLIPYDRLDSKAFIIGLVYTTASGVFYAAYINEDPVARYRQIARAYWIGATIGAALGLASYFKIEPLYSVFPDFGGRALGGYKDPNVFSTWLVLPMVTMLQAFVLGSLRLRPVAIVSFLMIFAALFLAFSRGAWINALMASAMTIGFTYLLSPSRQLRGRIAFSALLGIALLAVILVILLSIPATRELFLDRFTLVKDYDAGETGRFGNQLNAIPKLMQLPFGFGPYQFGAIYNLAPHNTFLNSFSSGGWIGGFAFMLFVITSIVVGFRTILIRTPFQPYAIPVFSCFVAVTFQGIQIDTEHWRHLYWMTGLVWGFFAASLAYTHRPALLADIAEGWNLPAPRHGRLQ